MLATPAFLLPPDEAERLFALRHYEAFDSIQEPLFDRFVVLATHLFSLPISLIALVGADEVSYPVNCGLPGLAGQPRVEALCAVVVQQNQAVIFHDLGVNDRHRLTEPAFAAAWAKGLRFYAGAPLCMPNRRTIGTLCVIDRQPRAFSELEQQALENLAGIVAQTIAMHYLCLIDHELGVARWQALRAVIQEEVDDLCALVRSIFARHSAPEALQPVVRRLHELSHSLANYRQQHD